MEPTRDTRTGESAGLSDPGLTDTHRPPAFSDEALALRFAARHAQSLRFVAGWGAWMEWTGSVWRRDSTLAAFDLARAICREAAAECNDSKLAQSVASAKTVAAVERLARADRRLAATVEQWDCNPMLLNTPSGIINLCDGSISPHRADDFLTRITAVAPGGECPRFIAFLHEITGGDEELTAYLRRVLGYSATALTREHALFFAHGTGANGKSVLLNTAAKVLGGYAKSAPVEAFMATRGDRIPNDIAGLRGARFVTSVETDDGKRWAEARLKQLTGGDVVSARFMRAEWFDFTPTFKIMIAGNHRPSLANVDEAIRRRLQIIPFSVTIPAAERDPHLAEALQAEWPGILTWMIAGCVDWQLRGLAPPSAVCKATETYLAAEDSIGAWTADQLEADRASWVSSSDLFASWRAWATNAGEAPGSQKALTGKLVERGWRKQDNRVAKGFAGYRLKPSEGSA
jgi:putative DNA primase/helicase